MFTTSEVCDLTGIPISTVVDWVARGFLRPARRGAARRGAGHLWSNQQAFGLAAVADLAAALSASRSRAGRYGVTSVMDRFEKLPDEAIAEWCRVEDGDAWSEEVAARNIALNAVEPPLELPPEMERPLRRVWEAVRARLAAKEADAREAALGRARTERSKKA